MTYFYSAQGEVILNAPLTSHLLMLVLHQRHHTHIMVMLELSVHSPRNFLLLVLMYTVQSIFQARFRLNPRMANSKFKFPRMIRSNPTTRLLMSSTIMSSHTLLRSSLFSRI